MAKRPTTTYSLNAMAHSLEKQSKVVLKLIAAAETVLETTPTVHGGKELASAIGVCNACLFPDAD